MATVAGVRCADGDAQIRSWHPEAMIWPVVDAHVVPSRHMAFHTLSARAHLKKDLALGGLYGLPLLPFLLVEVMFIRVIDIPSVALKAEIIALFEDVNDVLFTDFRGLSVAEITQLRNTLREAETEYKVVTNNYTKIAMQEMGLPDASEFLFGPTALALVRNEAGPVAKTITLSSDNGSTPAFVLLSRRCVPSPLPPKNFL